MSLAIKRWHTTWTIPWNWFKENIEDERQKKMLHTKDIQFGIIYFVKK